MELDGDEVDEHGAKVHSLVIRQPPKRAKRTKKNKEHQLLIRAASEEEDEEGEAGRFHSPAAGPKVRGRVSFNPDGSISLQRRRADPAAEADGAEEMAAEVEPEEGEEGVETSYVTDAIEDGMDEEEEV